MKYLCASVLALTLCFLIGCGERSPEQSADEPKGGGGATAERGPGLEDTGLQAAEPGEKWTVKNRVPLIDEPREYGAREEFNEHLVAALPRGTTIEVLDKTAGGWLQVKAAVEDGAKEGWIAIKNVLRAEKVPAEE